MLAASNCHEFVDSAGLCQDAIELDGARIGNVGIRIPVNNEHWRLNPADISRCTQLGIVIPDSIRQSSRTIKV
jgi:hypothetical protein